MIIPKIRPRTRPCVVGCHTVDVVLQRQLDAGLVDHRPWRVSACDGGWQLVRPAPRKEPDRARQVLTAADVLRNLGFQAP